MTAKPHRPLKAVALMAKNSDTFGFEDLEKAFKRIEGKYKSKGDAFLMSMAKVAATRTKSKTPVGKTKKLRGTWRTKKPKTYGKARVARMQSANRYAHLVERGHEVVHGGSSRASNGRKLNALGRKVRGVSVGGRTQGAHMISEAMNDIESTFGKSAEKLLDELTREVQL